MSMQDKTLSLLQTSLREEIEKIFTNDIVVAIDAFFDGMLTAVDQERHVKELDKNLINQLKDSMQEIVRHKASFHLESMLKGLEKPLIELSILLHNIKKRR